MGGKVYTSSRPVYSVYTVLASRLNLIHPAMESDQSTLVKFIVVVVVTL